MCTIIEAFAMLLLSLDSKYLSWVSTITVILKLPQKPAVSHVFCVEFELKPSTSMISLWRRTLPLSGSLRYIETAISEAYDGPRFDTVA